MTISLGGFTIPDENVIAPTSVEPVHIGNQRRSLGGTMLSQTFARKLKWQIETVDLTQSEFDSLYAVLTSTASQTFNPPEDNNTHSVVVMQDSIKWEEEPAATSGTIYHVEFTVEEA